ncbi:hypothetical protein GCM10028798_30780 [Humibacter antri]
MTHHEQHEAELRQHITHIIEAIGAKDVDALRRLYAGDVVSFDVEPPLQHVGIDAKLRNWVKAFAVFDRLAYEVRDLQFEVGDDVAFGHGFGRLSGVLRNGTRTPGMWVRVSYGFRRIGGEWSLVHDHVSVPFDVTTGRGVADLAP